MYAFNVMYSMLHWISFCQIHKCKCRCSDRNYFDNNTYLEVHRPAKLDPVQGDLEKLVSFVNTL